MLLPDNVHPENSVYYNGAVVLQALRGRDGTAWLDLFQEVQNTRKMSVAVFVLCLDWLFLADIISVDNIGLVRKCS